MLQNLVVQRDNVWVKGWLEGSEVGDRSWEGLGLRVGRLVVGCLFSWQSLGSS